MLVLHAGWLPRGGKRDAALAVWAESDAAGSRRRGGDMPRHPFAASHAALRSELARQAPDLLPAGTDAEVAAYLPAAEGVPLPSPEFAGLIGSAAAALDMQRFLLPVVCFPVSAAVRLLTSLAEPPCGAASVQGCDLSFWQQAAWFTLALLARERFVPDLQVSDGRFVSRWRPLVREGADARRAELLASSLPSAARALTWSVEDAVLGPRTALLDYLTEAVDALAREALAGRGRPVADAAPAEAWLASLCDARTLTGRPVELSAFQHVFAQWARPSGIGMDAGSPFRLCFRLQPPPDGPSGAVATPWRLDYLLQASDDPSLFVPAEAVWHARSGLSAFVDRRFEHPQERLLGALGLAARLFPPIEQTLHSAAPEACELDAVAAYRFVREASPVLAERGFGVLLPGMENRVGLRVRLSTPASSPGTTSGPATFSWDSVVQFDWEVAVGEETLSRAEFEALVNLKAPLVQVRGQWVELRPELIERALALFRQHPYGDTVDLSEALRLALAPDSDGALPIASVSADGMFGELLSHIREGGEREELAEPEGFTGQLRPYQKTGVSWLATLRRLGLGACLADDMGLGKTIQLIALLLHARAEQDVTAPVLLICPTSVAANWRRELEKFGPSLRVLVYHGAERRRDELVSDAGNQDIVISTYALLHRDVAALGAVHWQAIILDEAQNIKNPGSRTAEAARSLKAPWRAALTGTPVENRLSDLWSLFQFLSPGLLGTAAEFRRTFSTPIERTGDAAASERLQKLVGPFVLRRLKSDRSIIADLPEKNEMKVFCSLTQEQATLYQAVLKSSLEEIDESDGIQRRGQILATLTKLKQVCDHPALLLHDGSRLSGRSGKLERLGEMLEEVVAEGDRALVFTQYAEMGRLLAEHLQTTLGQEIPFLHGGVNAQARERMVTRFQAEGRGPQVFVLSIKAGGTGLNLTRANHVFHFDRWWNPAVENQATDRAFRIGQRRDVQVHKYICAGTFEETLDQLIERKLALAQTITGSNESWITELSNAELREMFSLKAGVG